MGEDVEDVNDVVFLCQNCGDRPERARGFCSAECELVYVRGLLAAVTSERDRLAKAIEVARELFYQIRGFDRPSDCPYLTVRRACEGYELTRTTLAELDKILGKGE